MKNRILASILVALTLSASMLTACGTPTDSGSTADTTTASADTTALEITEAPEYVVPDADYSGREFIFSSWITDKPNWVATSYNEAGVEALNGDIINDAIYERNAKVKEDLGITITVRSYKSASEMLNSTLAGDHYADTVLLFGEDIAPIVNQDLATDLLAVPTLDLSKDWWEQNAIEELTLGDHLFFAPGHISSFGQMGIFVTYFNKNMIEQFNLDNPYDLVRDGTWTFDKMVEMCEVVSSDLDGDGTMGKNDRFGMASQGATDVYHILASGERITEKGSDGMPELTINTERAANVIEKLVPFYRNKNLCMYASDFSSGYTNVFSQLLVPTFIADKMLFQHQWLCVALELRNMESDFGILPISKYDESQDGYYAPSTNSWSIFAVVPVTVPDLEFTGDVMNALGYYGREFVNTALIETTITGKSLRDTDTEEMLNLIYDSRINDLALFYNWGDVVTTLNKFVSGNSTSFASTIATVEEKANAAIDETMEKYLG